MELTFASVSAFFPELAGFAGLVAGIAGESRRTDTRTIDWRTLSVILAVTNAVTTFAVGQNRAQSRTIFAVPSRLAVTFAGPWMAPNLNRLIMFTHWTMCVY